MTLASNVYGWTQLADRQGIPFTPAWAMGEAKAAGLTGWEHAFDDGREVAGVAAAAAAAGLGMPSAYIGGALHDPARAEGEISRMVGIARRLVAAGTCTIVTNPDPIRWGGPENKSDAELEVQARMLQRLGEAVTAAGGRLLYHTHAPEMRAGARELHHMLLATDPAAVGFCLDVHWVWRGAERSQVALFDIVTLYAPRIEELHLRQSRDDIWTESVGDGDLDFAALGRHLAARGVKARLVLEHVYEEGTPATLGNVDAHRMSRDYLVARLAAVAAP